MIASLRSMQYATSGLSRSVRRECVWRLGGESIVLQFSLPDECQDDRGCDLVWEDRFEIEGVDKYG